MLLPLLLALIVATDERPRVESVTGEVAAVHAEDRSVAVRADDGALVVVSVGEETTVVRSPPGARSLEGAAPMAIGDVAPGDRVLAQGRPSPDGKTLAALRIVVMTRSDIEERHRKERAEWRRRGLAGTVTAVDPKALTAAVRVRAPEGSEDVLVETEGRDVLFRRYAPDSVRFSDARPGTFGDLGVGDQVYLLGARSDDGRRFAPEQIVSGAFRTVVGRLVSVDTEKGRLSLVEDGTDGEPRTVAVVVGEGAILRRIPAEMSARLTARGRWRGAAGRPGSEAEGPKARGGDGSWGAGAARGPRRVGGLDDLLERLPPITVADLRPGEGVAVLGPRPVEGEPLTAIKVVAGLGEADRPTPGRGARGTGADREEGSFGDVPDLGGDLPW
jgi:hypothetical protein